MAQLTRKFLIALGIEEDKIDVIVNAHQDTLEEIKAERDSLKDNASKLAEAQAEVTRLSGELETAKKNGGDAAKIQAEFDAYKQQVETDKANTAKTAALRKALKAAGVQRDEFTELLLGKVDLAAIELDGDTVKEPEKLIDPLRTAYGGCFATQQQQGTPPNNPPTGGGGTGKTKEQIMAIRDPAVRQAEIAKNPEAFGLKFD